MATTETLGKPVISTEPPHQAEFNQTNIVIYGPNTDTGSPPFEHIIKFNEKNSLTNFSLQQLKEWFAAGAVIVIVSLDNAILSMIISFPLMLSVQNEDEINPLNEFSSSYSTHLVTDTAIRGRGLASVTITALIKYGHANHIYSGFHQISHPTDEMKLNPIQVKWWFRILNARAAQGAGYKFPLGKSKHHYTVGLIKNPAMNKPTYDQFNDIVTRCPAELKPMACKHNYDILTASIDCYYLEDHGIIFGLSYLRQCEFTGAKQVKCAHLGLLIDTRDYSHRLDESMETILKLIYSVAAYQKCDLLYIPEIGSLNKSALDVTRACQTTTPMYVTWYNSGVTGKPKTTCLPLF